MSAGYSTVAGVLAGFALSGLILVLTTTMRSARAANQEAGPELALAAKALFAAFIGLVLTSITYAVLQGEPKASGRLASEEVFAGAGFGVSGVLLLYALVMLVHAADRSYDGPLASVARTVHCVMAVVVCPSVVVQVAAALDDYADVTPSARWLQWAGIGAAAVVWPCAVVFWRRGTARSIGGRKGSAEPVLVGSEGGIWAAYAADRAPAIGMLVVLASQIAVTVCQLTIDGCTAVPPAFMLVGVVALAAMMLTASFGFAHVPTPLPGDRDAAPLRERVKNRLKRRPLGAAVCRARSRMRGRVRWLAAPAMTAPVVADRVRHHARDSYLTLYSVMKGASLVAAVVAVDRLLRDADIALLLLWLASVALVCQTYYSTLIGAQLLPSSVDVPDVVLPALVTIAETELLVVLAGDAEQGTLVANWLVVYAGFACAVALLLTWVRARLSAGSYEPADLRADLIEGHLDNLRRSRSVVSASGLAALVGGGAAKIRVLSFDQTVVVMMIGAVALLVLVIALLDQRREAQRITAMLVGVEPGRSRPAASA